MSARKERLRVVRGLAIGMAALTALAASPRASAPPEKDAKRPVVSGEAMPVHPTPTPAAVAPAGIAEPAEFAPGLRAFKDPKTGKLREAEQEELRQLARAARGKGPRTLRALDAGGAGLQTFEGPDGAVGIALDESYATALLATVGSDGQVHLQHVDGLDAGDALVRAGAAGTKEDRHER